jgi:hypothetical protein
LLIPLLSKNKMKKYDLYIFSFCFLASIFVAGIFLFNSNRKQIVAVSDFLRPDYFDAQFELELEEVDDMSHAAKSIALEINGEKHLGILSLDVFSFSDALDFCQSKGLKMPNGISLMTTTIDAHEYGGKNK